VDQKLHYIHQEGPHVFKYAVRKFAETSARLLERNHVGIGDIDLFVAHQANIRIIDAAKERLGLPEEKVVKNIHEYGNTTAATIPLLWDECVRAGRVRPGDLVLMLAFGAGMGWGALLLRA
jgi:3-oxoacyl-[acyl-carrier-protein] synthase-3